MAHFIVIFVTLKNQGKIRNLLNLSRVFLSSRQVTTSYTRFFYKQRFFSTQSQCCLTLSWIELQMLFRCCLINKGIIIVRHIIHLLYLRPCLHLGLFMLYLCDLFFIFIVIFIMFNRIISWIQTHLFFSLLFRMCPITFEW